MVSRDGLSPSWGISGTAYETRYWMQYVIEEAVKKLVREDTMVSVFIQRRADTNQFQIRYLLARPGQTMPTFDEFCDDIHKYRPSKELRTKLMMVG